MPFWASISPCILAASLSASLDFLNAATNVVPITVAAVSAKPIQPPNAAFMRVPITTALAPMFLKLETILTANTDIAPPMAVNTVGKSIRLRTNCVKPLIGAVNNPLPLLNTLLTNASHALCNDFMALVYSPADCSNIRAVVPFEFSNVVFKLMIFS